MTALVTCDQLVSSFTSALDSASQAQLDALSQAMADAGVSGGASGAAGGALTGTYPNPGLNPAAVQAALTSGGVGTGGFVQMTNGATIPSGTPTTLASWTAPRAGKIAVSFNYLATFNTGVDGAGAARITKNGSIVSAAESQRNYANAYVASHTSRAYLEVDAGDVIAGVASVTTSDSTSATSTNLGFPDAAGLGIHYFA